MLARRVMTTLGIAAVAVAITAVGDVGAANAATAAPANSDRNVTASADGVLVKEVATARGTLDIFKESAPHHAVSNTVVPHSSTGCAGSNPEVCLYINGSGLYVNYMENDTHFGAAGGADMQINGPSGIIVDSGWFNENGGWYYIRWSPYNYIGAGYYCATTYVGGGREGACNTVHN